MKTQLLLFLSLILSVSCSPKLAQELKGSTITYQAISRGFYLNVELQGNIMTISRQQDTDGEDVVLKAADFKIIQNLYKKLKLKQLSNYRAPTEQRFHDGAAIATLTINNQGESYASQAFDHGNPPLEIADFVNKIVSLTEN